MIALWLAAGVLAGAQVTIEAPPVRRGGGVTTIHRQSVRDWLLERQLKEFEDALEEVAEAEEPEEAIEAAVEAFAPIVARVDDPRTIGAIDAISKALKSASDNLERRNEAVRRIEAQLAVIAEVERAKVARRRKDEAALFMLGAL